MRTTRLNLLRGVRLPLLSIEGEEDDTGAGAGAPAADPPPATDPPPEGGAGEGGEGGGDGGAPPAPAAAEGGAGDPPPAADPPPPKRIPWQNRRIDQLTARVSQAEERNAELEREAQAARERAAAYEALYGRAEDPPAGGAPPPPPAGGAAPPTSPTGERLYTKTELEAEAARVANVNRLNERIEGVFNAGATAHGKAWTERVSAAGAAFGTDLQKRPDLFEALTALPNPEAVYFQLAGDLDHFADVLAMPPIQLGMELARLSVAAGGTVKPQRLSNAPAPITPVEGNGGGGGGGEETTEQYAERRERERAARYAGQR